ncbi:Lipocalin-like domain-containing protein [Sphingobacterium nematocida]|uniref:Lipocalin-like domain-containing protein n=2 Tax=Sphingobacterium nematocida TaxID=1513896 RepID=A0A1T5G0V2_9SPHI|nr:Lipocalin-like domain-containing protein [Sphingobacterium nematocida]
MPFFVVLLNNLSKMTSIKNEIIGTWELLSYIEVPVDGVDSFFPFGKSPKGLLLYSPDGYMAVQISGSDEIKYISNDRMQASAEELDRRVRGYIAFSGKYTIDNRNAHVVYDISNSLFPNWEESQQVRKLDFEGDVLYQKSLEPIRSGGQTVHAYMTWKRIGRAVDLSEFHEEAITDFLIEASPK